MASYSDNFDRANGEIGANWVEDNGDIDIVSNRAENQTSSDVNRARYASALDGNDHYCQCDIDAQSSLPDGSVTCRQASSTQTMYNGHYVEFSNGTGYRIQKIVGGSFTTLDSATSTTGERTLKLTVDGATQSLKVDTVEVCSDIDSDISTGTYCGAWGYGNEATYNNWSAEDLGAAGISIPVVIHHLTKNIGV